MLRDAGMPLTNLIYSGGGRFYALLPGQVHGRPTAAWLSERRAFFDAFLLRHHQGELYLALGGEALPRDAVGADAGKAFSAAWGRATQNANAAKRRRFGALDATGLASLFCPEGGGGALASACAICDYQGDDDEFKPIDPDDEQGGVRCKLCQSFEQLGRLLHNARYLLLRALDRPRPPAPQGRGPRHPWYEILDDLGTHVQLLGDHATLRDAGNRSPSWPVRSTTALVLKAPTSPYDEGLPADLQSITLLVRGFRPVANASPTVRTDDEVQAWERIRRRAKELDRPEERPVTPGDIKPFSLMVDQSKGVKRLGVLRMDVDDLGDLFRYRLDGGLARVSALSAALALFFEGRVGVLCDACNAAPPERIYSIYSGGDDLFIVGSWDELPALADAIRRDLARFTGNNPAVHVSAGISLHTAKFPLYQAAADAEKELKRAKARDVKNALGFLGQVVGWEHAKALFELQRGLLDFTGERADDSGPPLSRAVLQTLQVLYAQYADGLAGYSRQKRSGQLFYGPWIWRGAYQLARIRQQVCRGNHPQREEAAALLKKVADGLLAGADAPPNTGGRAIERNGLAARWAELLLRKESD